MINILFNSKFVFQNVERPEPQSSEQKDYFEPGKLKPESPEECMMNTENDCQKAAERIWSMGERDMISINDLKIDYLLKKNIISNEQVDKIKALPAYKAFEILTAYEIIIDYTQLLLEKKIATKTEIDKTIEGKDPVSAAKLLRIMEMEKSDVISTEEADKLKRNLNTIPLMPLGD